MKVKEVGLPMSYKSEDTIYIPKGAQIETSAMYGFFLLKREFPGLPISKVVFKRFQKWMKGKEYSLQEGFWIFIKSDYSLKRYIKRNNLKIYE